MLNRLCVFSEMRRFLSSSQVGIAPGFFDSALRSSGTLPLGSCGSMIAYS
jgi:hypothetical protein